MMRPAAVLLWNRLFRQLADTFTFKTIHNKIHQ